ncbi:MAG: hypothetical protein KDA32_00940 [Phycisphaerales bacterium]|nr:hypothetical protein [Phycisphaerales bacterium]
MAIILAGCAMEVKGPNLGALYDRAAQLDDLDRHPVIVIPGILGSRLVDPEGDQIVWGAFGGHSIDPEAPDGARLLALPMRRGAALAELRDDVRTAGVLDRAKIELLGLPIELAAYAQILGTLGAGGFRDQQLAEAGAVNYGSDHFTCFQFAYDWRRDNVENAAALKRFIDEKHAFIQKQYAERFGIQNADIKFDIVAHSMGGLVTRYFLRYGDADLPDGDTPPPITWAGAEHVRQVIIVGTPNAGSALALKQLVEGTSYSPLLPRYDAAILGTMPSIYQLLTRPRHRALIADSGESIDDALSLERWKAEGWGLANPNADAVLKQLLPDIASADERRAIAEEHLDKCLTRARRFFAALDSPATPPAGVRLSLYVGDAVDTPAQLEWSRKNRELRISETTPGDGTVTRQSALMDERRGGQWDPRVRTPIDWYRTTFLFEDHLGLTRAQAFSDNVLYSLLEEPH